MIRITFLLATLSLIAAVSVQGQARTVWDGVYTEAQAERGDKLYQRDCGTCHGAEMRAGAGAPSLSGPEFTFGWEGKPLGNLFEFLRANMPPGQAGSLKDAEYAEIMAAMLKRNGVPASATELPAAKADLDTITFKADKP